MSQDACYLFNLNKNDIYIILIIKYLKQMQLTLIKYSPNYSRPHNLNKEFVKTFSKI